MRTQAGHLYLNVQHSNVGTHTHTRHIHLYWMFLYTAVIYCLSRAVHYPAVGTSLSVTFSLDGLMREDDQ